MTYGPPAPLDFNNHNDDTFLLNFGITTNFIPSAKPPQAIFNCLRINIASILVHSQPKVEDVFIGYHADTAASIVLQVSELVDDYQQLNAEHVNNRFSNNNHQFYVPCANILNFHFILNNEHGTSVEQTIPEHKYFNYMALYKGSFFPLDGVHNFGIIIQTL